MPIFHDNEEDGADEQERKNEDASVAMGHGDGSLPYNEAGEDLPRKEIHHFFTIASPLQ